VCATFAGLTPFPLHAADNDHLIVPGVGIGHVHLSMSPAQMIALWGPAKVLPGEETAGHVVYQWQTSTGGYLMAVIDSPGHVASLSVRSDSHYVTAEGVHTNTPRVGSSPSVVLRAFGPPDRRTTMNGAQSGMPRTTLIEAWFYHARGLMISFMWQESAVDTKEVFEIDVARPMR
jgi:hypothetical protein